VLALGLAYGWARHANAFHDTAIGTFTAVDTGIPPTPTTSAPLALHLATDWRARTAADARAAITALACAQVAMTHIRSGIVVVIPGTGSATTLPRPLPASCAAFTSTTSTTVPAHAVHPATAGAHPTAVTPVTHRGTSPTTTQPRPGRP
jgi:hypothetical protein